MGEEVYRREVLVSCQSEGAKAVCKGSLPISRVCVRVLRYAKTTQEVLVAERRAFLLPPWLVATDSQSHSN